MARPCWRRLGRERSSGQGPCRAESRPGAAPVRRGARRRRAVLLLALLALALGMRAEAEEQPRRRLLLIYAAHTTLTANVEATAGVTAVLDAALKADYEVYAEHRDDRAFPAPRPRAPSSRDMDRKYRGQRFDAILAFGHAALTYLLAHQDELAPGVPVVFGGIGEAVLAGMRLPPNVHGIVSRYSVPGSLALARRLQPWTRRAVIFSGSGGFDRSWEERARRELADVQGIAIDYVSDRTLDGFQQIAAGLDAGTILIIPRPQRVRRGHDPAGAERASGARPGAGPRGGGGRRSVPPLRHDQAGRARPRPVDLPHDRAGAWRHARLRSRRDPGRAGRAGAAAAMTPPEPSTLIHLVDDDPAVLRALRRLLAATGHGCATYASAEAFLARPAADAPGCAVIDLQLPGASGLDLQASLAACGEILPVIFLTGRGDIGASVRAMKGGAVDFLTKPVEPQALLAAIAAALARGQALRATRLAEAGAEQRLARLTPREREVLDRVVEGRLNKQIAADLGIAEKTIKVHRARLMRKLGVRTIADLVRLVVGGRS